MDPVSAVPEATDVAAFFARYSDAVLRLCRRITANDADAEDARQEAFLQLQRHWVRLDPSENRIGWLFRTAANAARKSRRHPQIRVRAEELEDESAPATLDPDEDRERIARAIAALPGEYRKLIRERFHRGRTPAEIARRLGIPAGRVRVQLGNPVPHRGDSPGHSFDTRGGIPTRSLWRPSGGTQGACPRSSRGRRLEEHPRGPRGRRSMGRQAGLRENLRRMEGVRETGRKGDPVG